MSKPDPRTTECRLWVVHGTPHVGYCTLRSTGDWFEVLVFFNGTMLLSRLFESMVAALMYAGAERDDLISRGWTIVDDLDVRATARPAASLARASWRLS